MASNSSASGEDRDPSTTHSSGNDGARGSRGQANSGAQAGNSTQEGGNQRAPQAGEPDLHGDQAQGGGGVASDSSRSK